MRRVTLLAALLGVLGCDALRAVPESVTAAVGAPAIPADRRQALAQALDRFRHQDFAAARSQFRALVGSYPQLADHHLYFAALCDLRLERSGEAERLLRRLLEEFPESVHAAPSQVELARLLLSRNQIDAARALLYRAAQHPDKNVAQPARLTLAEAEERAGYASSAYSGFQSLRQEVPNTPVGRVAKEHAVALRIANPELAPTGRARLEEAQLLLKERAFPEAEKLAAAIVERPEGIDIATALRLQADALYGQGRVEPALKLLWSVAERFPSSDEAPAAMFRMANILWNRDRDSAALRAFEDFRKSYPRHDKALEALYAIGRIHQQADRLAAAEESYNALARRAPQSKLAREARWRIAWMRYQAGNWSAAANAFGALRSSGGDTTYWQARATEQTGNRQAAKKLYSSIIDQEPHGYYALLAGRRLAGSDGPLRLGSGTIDVPAVPSLPAAPFAETFHLPRFEELRLAGQHTLARAELAALERSPAANGATTFFARAYLAVDGFNDVGRLAKRNRSSLSGIESEQYTYPLAFWTIVAPQSEAATIDPLLVVSIMRQESAFDPLARSPADARGLMQLLPSTAERVANAAGNFAVDPTRLEDPEVNIELGVRYLQSLAQRYNGDPIKMIAAYNGGETAVDKWQANFAGLPPDEFVESITFRETRDYVKRVLSNYQRYRYLYASRAG